MKRTDEKKTPLGSAPGYGDATEGTVGQQGSVDDARHRGSGTTLDETGGTQDVPFGTNVGGDESHGATRRIGQDPGKGSQGFGNE